jgi:hypothetical protein
MADQRLLAASEVFGDSVFTVEFVSSSHVN